MNGWSGERLEIDLSSGTVHKKGWSSEIEGTFLGGRGVNAKLFWDRVPPETEPFSPENLLIFGAGSLTGTKAPGTNRTIVTTKSPTTRLLTYSTVGGFWAGELRKAGFDSLVLSGKSPVPVYLWIEGGRVEIRDASHLWGKDTEETKRILLEEVKDNRAQILCIGPAGENRVHAASIEQSAGASASRTGAGAVMGDKKVKAIVARGTREIPLIQPEGYSERCKRILGRLGKVKGYLSDYSHNRIQGHVNASAYGNMGKSVPWPNVGDVHAEFLRTNRIKKATCGNCPISCKSVMRLADGRASIVKCTSWFVFMSASKIQDFTFSLECFNRCERYGLDSTSTASLVAFTIELFQQGILGEKDTEGLRLDWGNPGAVFSLIEKIARREGIGEILADGVRAAARRFNRGAEEQAFHVKGLELLPFPLYTPYMTYAAALSDRADMMKALGQSLTQRMSNSPEEKEKYIAAGFFPYPEEFRKYLWLPVEWAGEDYERYAQCISYETDSITLSDCTGTCIYWTGHYPFPPFQCGDMAGLISLATGIETDHEVAMKTTRRVSNLTRAYHLLSGLRKKDDTVPEKFFNDPPPPPKMALTEQKLDRMKSVYYQTRGWDDNGVPKKETLDALGLDDVRRALEKKGILTP